MKDNQHLNIYWGVYSMWKQIKNFPYYEISDNGEVRAYKTKRQMKPLYDKDGYCCVKLYKNNKYYHKRIHRLVLENFVREPKDFEECHHINEIRDDNRLKNLKWVSRQENDSYVQHTVNSGSYEKVPVFQMALDDTIITGYGSMSDASRATDCQVSKISAVCRGERKTTGGYKWRYQ